MIYIHDLCNQSTLYLSFRSMSSYCPERTRADLSKVCRKLGTVEYRPRMTELSARSVCCCSRRLVRSGFFGETSVEDFVSERIMSNLRKSLSLEGSFAGDVGQTGG